MRQHEKRFEPFILRVPIAFDLHPVVCPTDDCANRDRYDVQQVMALALISARIRQVLEMLG